MRVLADTHALYWYLISPDRLSPRSLEVLGQAEDSDGIAVSALTIPELWVSVSRKRGDRAIPPAGTRSCGPPSWTLRRPPRYPPGAGEFVQVGRDAVKDRAYPRKVDGYVGGVWPVAGWAQVDRGRVATSVELGEPVRAASQPPHFIGEPVGDGEAACT